MIDITAVCTAIIGLMCAIITVKVIPYIKANVSKTQLEEVSKWVEFAVNAAEQLANAGKIPKAAKFEYVNEFVRKVLNDKGYTINTSDLKVMIEGFVNKLPAYLEAVEVREDDKNE